MRSFCIIIISFTTLLATASTASEPGYNTVNLRVEGKTETLWEGPIYSGPRNITTAKSCSEGSCPEPCDGTLPQNFTHPPAGNTCLAALDAASKIKPFTYDGIFDGEFDDFGIDTIGADGPEDPNTAPNGNVEFGWGLLWNYQPPTYGLQWTLSGCQQKVVPGDTVLWAWIPARNERPIDSNFLKVSPETLKVKQYATGTVTVTDGRTGKAVQGAVVDGVTTGTDGKATITFHHKGFQQYKATRTGDVRSNVLNVTVT